MHGVFVTHTTDALISASDQLEEVTSRWIFGRELAWTEQMANALRLLQSATSQHVEDCETGDGVFSKLSLARPGLVRQIAGLRQAHLELPFLINMLQHQVFSAAHAFSSVHNPVLHATDLPFPGERESAVDFKAIRQAGIDLVRILRNHLEHEADILHKSVMSDLGAGE